MGVLGGAFYKSPEQKQEELVKQQVAAQSSALQKAADDKIKANDQSDVKKATLGYQQYMNQQMGFNSPSVMAGTIDNQQIANADTAASRAQQMQALGLTQNAAQGMTPSVAQMQMHQGLDQAMMQQMAAANSGHGGFNPMAARMAMIQGAGMQQGVAANSAMLRAQEMAQAREQYLQGTGAMRTQDLGAAQAQAAMNYQTQAQNVGNQMQAGFGNAQNLLATQGMKNGLQAQYLNSVLGLNANNLQAEQAAAALAQQKSLANQANESQMWGAGLGALGAIGGAFIGGPGGAKVGATVGSAAGSAVR